MKNAECRTLTTEYSKNSKRKEVNEMIDLTYDYSKIRGKIKEVFGTQAAFADAMKMSTVSLSEKLNNKVNFPGQKGN